MFALFRGRRTAARPDPRARLGAGFDTLEDRTAPAVHSSIVSDFNGTAIPGGDSIWLNSETSLSSLPAVQPVTVHVVNQKVTFNLNGTPATVPVPDAAVTFGLMTSTFAAATSSGGGAWATSAPAVSLGNTFLSGTPFPVPAGGIAGGSVKGVTWEGDFWADAPGVRLTWQWSAAVYKTSGTEPASLGVKPIDSATSQYFNFDHAGTPERYKASVTGGALGGGGTNYTGSPGSQVTVTLDQTPAVSQPPAGVTADISGIIRDDSGNAVPGLTMTLTGTDSNGHAVIVTTTTGGDGSYSFAGVASGTYTLTLSYDHNVYSAANPIIGSLGGQGSDGCVTGIALNGTDGTGYDFVLVPMG